MLDISVSIVRLQLITLQVATATVTGASVIVSNTNTGDVLACTLNATNVTGTTPSVVVQLQDSADNASWANIAVNAVMPATAFAAVTASLAAPVVIPIDPRGIRKYVRAVATITGTTPSMNINVDLERRPLQIGFNSVSG